MTIANSTIITPDEFSRRGNEIYERVVRPSLHPQDDEKFVAIDIESADFEIDKDDFEATERLLIRRPQAQIWLERVGHIAAYRIGAALPLVENND